MGLDQSSLGRIVLTGAALLVLAACAGTRVTHGQAASVYFEGNVLTNSVGERLSFVSINNEPLGNIFSVAAAGDSLSIKLKNPKTGRQATVRVDLDPTTKKFMTVAATTVPFMCYDDQIDPCAASVIPTGFTSAGAAVLNCASPIFFNGPISGSVENLTQDHAASCGK